MLNRIYDFSISCLRLSLWNLRLRLRAYHLFVTTMLYLFMLVFICYLILDHADFPTKTALFWLILFLISLYFIQQSMAEDAHSMTFYYFLLSPQVFLVANIIQYTLIGFGLAWLNSLAFYGLFHYEVADLSIFSLLLLLAAFGFSSLFSFLSALSRHSSQSSGILSILSLPLLIPQLSLIMKIAAHSNDSMQWQNLLSLVSLDLLILGLALILFPYLWKL